MQITLDTEQITLDTEQVTLDTLILFELKALSGLPGEMEVDVLSEAILVNCS